MYVFVYGTLKKGFENNHFLNGAKFIGNVITKEKYPMVNIVKAYPYIINDVGNGYNIKGELYKINKSILNKLDMLEGYPEHYDRIETIVLSKNQEYNAIIYFVKDKIDYSNLELLEEFEKDEFYYFEDD